jgi:hypothetical protein
MNIQQRITKLEQVTSPAKDTREPLLLKFIGDDEPREKAGILYVYHGKNADTYELNSQQLAEYEASERNGTSDIWLNNVPRPAMTVELEQVYSREPNFRTGAL